MEDQNIKYDDNIQKMIWKETMFIINTYIKFNTPTPTKQLVNYISMSLRNIILNEEVKLYKSKTSLKQNIAETEKKNI